MERLMYKVILIDIDDTLFDYKKAEDNAIRRVFEDFEYFKKEKNVERFEEIKKKYRYATEYSIYKISIVVW